MRTLVVIEEEDDLCTEAAETVLLGVFQVRRARDAERAVTLSKGTAVYAFMIASPVELAPPKPAFWRWRRQEEQPSAMERVRSSLSVLRGAGHDARVIIQGLPSAPLEPLRDRYGDVHFVTPFDPMELRDALGEQRASPATLAALVGFGERINRALRSTERGVPDRMVEMFLRDVYGRPGEPSASQRFADLNPGDFGLQKVQETFSAVDSMEQSALARDPQTLTVLAMRVREIDHSLRVLKDIRSTSKPT